MKIILIFYFMFMIFVNISGQTKIAGFVKDDSNKPLYGANVVIENTIDGATTDSTGFYEFETNRTGSLTLMFTAIEFNEKKLNIKLESGVHLEVDAKLSKAEVVTDEILVTASSFTSGTQHSQVTLTSMDIARIPGSDADIYRAITTFPGSNQVDEGSRITVRGGDPSEVMTIMDQATLYNPFMFDDDFNSSSYSTINVWGLQGINFSSGGFSAKYGNVLSAVLDLKSYDMPTETGAFLWLGLEGPSISGVFRTPERNLGGSITARHTFLDPYFKINGYLKEDYSPLPVAKGLGGTLTYSPWKNGYIKFTGDYSGDQVGVRNVQPYFDGFYNSKSHNYFGNLEFSTGIGIKSLLNSSLSFSAHEHTQGYGVMNIDQKEYYSKSRTDLNYNLSKGIDLNTGLEYEYNELQFNGRLPQFSYYNRPESPYFDIYSNKITGRIGGYLEAQYKITNNLFIVPGIRADYHTLSKKTAIDPRFSLGLKLNDENVIRASTGLYHQFPSLEYYAQSKDNELKPEEAIHYILGYEMNKYEGVFLFRAEGYYKDYNNLVLYDKNNFRYYSGGTGIAKGVDVFVKSKITNKYAAWISYSYTDSKRKQYEADKEVDADYDITHSFTLVSTYNINEFLTTGLTYRTSTGKPFTPITGSYFEQSNGVYAPVYGDMNSERFPVYSRVDVNLQYMFSLFNRFAILVFQVNNVFNNKNLYDYTYNSDYTKRIEVVSSNKRQFYVGFGMQF